MLLLMLDMMLVTVVVLERMASDLLMLMLDMLLVTVWS